ncbi:MAG: DUF1499 domain-containing protein [Bacteroidetes bacterium]|nr:DUF1499 domain-containing protein [Bacteroidota bacterium]
MKSKTFKYPSSDVFNAVVKALKSLDMDIEEKDKNNGIIVATAGTTLLSWGNSIRVKITPGAGTSKVSVESESKMLQISWGKNTDYENDIIDEIGNHLG